MSTCLVGNKHEQNPSWTCSSSGWRNTAERSCQIFPERTFIEANDEMQLWPRVPQWRITNAAISMDWINMDQHGQELFHGSSSISTDHSAKREHGPPVYDSIIIILIYHHISSIYSNAVKPPWTFFLRPPVACITGIPALQAHTTHDMVCIFVFLWNTCQALALALLHEHLWWNSKYLGTKNAGIITSIWQSSAPWLFICDRSQVPSWNIHKHPIVLLCSSHLIAFSSQPGTDCRRPCSSPRGCGQTQAIPTWPIHLTSRSSRSSRSSTWVASQWSSTTSILERSNSTPWQSFFHLQRFGMIRGAPFLPWTLNKFGREEVVAWL